MTKQARCILADKRKDGCAACTETCAHRIALEGLNGKGGRIGAARLPADYARLTLTNSPAREGQGATYDTLERYVATFERMFDAGAGRDASLRIKSLYLWSESPGTGKTTTAAALLNEYIAANYIGSMKRGVQPAQRPAYFLDVNAFQELYTGFTRQGVPREIAERNSRPYYTQMELAKKTPFVVLDDIGVRQASDGFRGDLHTIINYRTTNGLPTIYTSNLTLDEMPTVFDARLADRMRDQCMTLHFTGTSKRGRR